MARRILIIALTLALAGAAAWYVLRERTAQPGAPPLPAQPVQAGPPVAADEFALARQEYERAKAALMDELDAREPTIAPEALEPVKENIGIIEGAVADLLLAITDNPDNESLKMMVIEMYRNEVDLLRKALRFSSPDDGEDG